MAGETTVYTILGYDKDADVYVRLANVYDGLNTATKIANSMAIMNLRRKSNNEPYDWIEVVEEYKDIRHHVVPCI